MHISFSYPQEIHPISFKDIYIYPEISLDIHMISQSDILVISQDIFFNIQTSYLNDIHRYPKISFHFHLRLPCPADLPQLLGLVRLCAPVQATLLAAGLPMFDLMGALSVVHGPCSDRSGCSIITALQASSSRWDAVMGPRLGSPLHDPYVGLDAESRPPGTVFGGAAPLAKPVKINLNMEKGSM